MSNRQPSRMRPLKLLTGFALLLIGGLLSIPGVPGPGIPVVVLGLWVLSDHFAWAKRALDWVGQRVPRFRRSKNGPATG
jgi:hypothetical protein